MTGYKIFKMFELIELVQNETRKTTIKADGITNTKIKLTCRF